MSKLLLIVLIGSVTSTVSVARAQQVAPKLKLERVQSTSITSGSQMYMSYCAACHGANGTGNGPAATAMKLPPADLTKLSRMNSGTFPENHVISVLRFGVEKPSHGSADMPVWGDLLRSLHRDSANPDPAVSLRIANLTGYLKTIQQ